MSRPDLSRVTHFYHKYIQLVTEDDLLTAFEAHSAPFISYLKSIPEEKRLYRYAPGKWSIQEMVQHLVDAERVFSYRALCFARMDTQPLPGFDENPYAEASRADSRNWNELMEEFECLRKATILLYRSFNAEQLEAGGISSGNLKNYVMALGFVILGHCAHHQSVLEERYL